MAQASRRASPARPDSLSFVLEKNNGPWLAPSGSSLINVGSALSTSRLPPRCCFCKHPENSSYTTTSRTDNDCSIHLLALIHGNFFRRTVKDVLRTLACARGQLHSLQHHGGGISCPCHQAVSKSHFDFRCSPREVTQISYYGADISFLPDCSRR
jgi:hypothetical protein